MDKIFKVQVVDDNVPLVDMGTCSSETDLPCMPELSGTTVPTKSLEMVELLDSPARLELLYSSAWSEPLDLPRPESLHSPWPGLPHSPQPESPVLQALLETVLEPTSVSLEDPATGMPDPLIRDSRTFSPCWMSSLY